MTEEAGAAGSEDYYTYGKYAGWASTGLKAIYMISNGSYYGLKAWVDFAPALALLVLDLMSEYGGTELLDEDTYKMLYHFSYESYAAEISRTIALFPIYFLR